LTKEYKCIEAKTLSAKTKNLYSESKTGQESHRHTLTAAESRAGLIADNMYALNWEQAEIGAGENDGRIATSGLWIIQIGCDRR
jgi:hypothetical protein